MGDIRVGTASWADKSLVDSKRFYPDEARNADERLRFYATRFATVEVDSSYYGLPSPRNAQLWAERTTADFSFVVKAFRLFTLHHTAPDALPKDIRAALGPPTKKNLYYADLPAELAIELWSRFRTALLPLQRVNKLAGVLFQFPPWVMRSRANYDHIVRCKEVLADAQICVEFRNRTWFDEGRRDDVLKFEREHAVSHVIVDEPQGFASSIPWVGEVTTPQFAMVRLHGRNANTWDVKGLTSSGERFNYLYPPTELSELAEKVRPVAAKAERTHVYFNNNFEDYGIRNALDFGQILGT